MLCLYNSQTHTNHNRRRYCSAAISLGCESKTVETKSSTVSSALVSNVKKCFIFAYSQRSRTGVGFVLYSECINRWVIEMASEWPFQLSRKCLSVDKVQYLSLLNNMSVIRFFYSVKFWYVKFSMPMLPPVRAPFTRKIEYIFWSGTWLLLSICRRNHQFGYMPEPLSWLLFRRLCIHSILFSDLFIEVATRHWSFLWVRWIPS